VLPKMFSAHSFMLVQQGGDSYKSILQAADQTTHRIRLALGALFLGLTLVVLKLLGVVLALMVTS